MRPRDGDCSLFNQEEVAHLAKACAKDEGEVM